MSLVGEMLGKVTSAGDKTILSQDKRAQRERDKKVERERDRHTDRGIRLNDTKKKEERNGKSGQYKS